LLVQIPVQAGNQLCVSRITDLQTLVSVPISGQNLQVLNTQPLISQQNIDKKPPSKMVNFTETRRKIRFSNPTAECLFLNQRKRAQELVTGPELELN